MPRSVQLHFFGQISLVKVLGAKYTNTHIQIHKYTNTVWSNLQIDPTSAIFLKRKWYQDLNNNVHKSYKYTIQIHKYTNTNTKI